MRLESYIDDVIFWGYGIILYNIIDSFPPFDWLFSFFGDRNVLDDIYALKS